MNTEQLNHQFVSQILKDIEQGRNPSASDMLQTSMNLLMMAERGLHLQEHPHDKGNGYFKRKLGTPMGELSLNVPRDRDGDFRSTLLPAPYERDYAGRDELIKSLLSAAYSPNQIQQTLEQLNLSYNPRQLDTIKEEYHQLFLKWQMRELPSDVVSLFIDAYHAQALIADKVCKVVVYAVLGVDFSGHKSLYGIYLYQGHETKAFWLQTLNQLIERGIKAPLFVVSDDFSGLKEAVATLFPVAYHQLCFIHMQRNVRRNMGKDDATSFNQALTALRLVPDKAQACTQFKTLCDAYKNQYPSFMKALIDNTDHYFTFLELPTAVRKYFYTTNAIESFNSLLEKIRQRAGGFFQSEDFLKVNVFLCVRSLEQRKWAKGMPMLKAHLYSVRQLFARKYQRLPDESKIISTLQIQTEYAQ